MNSLISSALSPKLPSPPPSLRLFPAPSQTLSSLECSRGSMDHGLPCCVCALNTLRPSGHPSVLGLVRACQGWSTLGSHPPHARPVSCSHVVILGWGLPWLCPTPAEGIRQPLPWLLVQTTWHMSSSLQEGLACFSAGACASRASCLNAPCTVAVPRPRACFLSPRR